MVVSMLLERVMAVIVAKEIRLHDLRTGVVVWESKP